MEDITKRSLLGLFQILILVVSSFASLVPISPYVEAIDYDSLTTQTQWNTDGQSVTSELDTVDKTFLNTTEQAITETFELGDVELDHDVPDIIITSDCTIGGSTGGDCVNGFPDSAGENHGEVAAGTPVSATAQSGFGDAVTLDGSNYFEVSDDNLEFAAADSFTVEFWAKYDASDTGNNCGAGLWGTTNGDRQYTLCKLQDATFGNVARFAIREQGGPQINADGITALNDGNWHHIVGVYDGTDDEIRVYVDGVEEATTATDGTLQNVNNAQVFTIGATDGGVSGDDLHEVDEIRVSDIERYTGNFTAPAGPFNVDSNTLALWHADDYGGDVSDFLEDGNTVLYAGSFEIASGATVTVADYTGSFGGNISILADTIIIDGEIRGRGAGYRGGSAGGGGSGQSDAQSIRGSGGAGGEGSGGGGAGTGTGNNAAGGAGGTAGSSYGNNNTDITSFEMGSGGGGAAGGGGGGGSSGGVTCGTNNGVNGGAGGAGGDGGGAVKLQALTINISGTIDMRGNIGGNGGSGGASNDGLVCDTYGTGGGGGGSGGGAAYASTGQTGGTGGTGGTPGTTGAGGGAGGAGAGGGSGGTIIINATTVDISSSTLTVRGFTGGNGGSGGAGAGAPTGGIGGDGGEGGMGGSGGRIKVLVSSESNYEDSGLTTVISGGDAGSGGAAGGGGGSAGSAGDAGDGATQLLGGLGGKMPLLPRYETGQYKVTWHNELRKADWRNITLNAEIPTSNSVQTQVYTSNSQSGPFTLCASNTDTTTVNDFILELTPACDNTDYILVNLTLTRPSANRFVTPAVHNVNVTFEDNIVISDFQVNQSLPNQDKFYNRGIHSANISGFITYNGSLEGIPNQVTGFNLTNPESGYVIEEEATTGSDGYFEIIYTGFPSDAPDTYLGSSPNTAETLDYDFLINDSTQLNPEDTDEALDIDSGIYFFEFHVNDDGYLNADGKDFNTGMNPETMYTWLEIRDVQNSLTNDFNNIFVETILTNPGTGLQNDIFNLTFNTPNTGNHTNSTDLTAFQYETHNATWEIKTGDTNGNNELQPQSISLSKDDGRLHYLTATITPSDTANLANHTLRTQTQTLIIDAYDSWTDALNDGNVDGDAGDIEDTTDFDTTIYNDDDHTTVEFNDASSGTGDTAAAWTIETTVSLDEKDVYVTLDSSGLDIDGEVWNDFNTQSEPSLSDGAGKFQVDDLEIVSVTVNDTSYSPPAAMEVVVDLDYAEFYTSDSPNSEPYSFINTTLFEADEQAVHAAYVDETSKEATTTNGTGYVTWTPTLTSIAELGSTWEANAETHFNSVNQSFDVDVVFNDTNWRVYESNNASLGWVEHQHHNRGDTVNLTLSIQNNPESKSPSSAPLVDDDFETETLDGTVTITSSGNFEYIWNWDESDAVNDQDWVSNGPPVNGFTHTPTISITNFNGLSTSTSPTTSSFLYGAYNITAEFDNSKTLVTDYFGTSVEITNVRSEAVQFANFTWELLDGNELKRYNDTFTTNEDGQHIIDADDQEYLAVAPTGIWNINATVIPSENTNNTGNATGATDVFFPGEDPLVVTAEGPYILGETNQFVVAKPITPSGTLIPERSQCNDAETCIHPGGVQIDLYFPNGTLYLENQNLTNIEPSFWRYNFTAESGLPVGSYTAYTTAQTYDGGPSSDTIGTLYAAPTTFQVWTCRPGEGDCASSSESSGGANLITGLSATQLANSSDTVYFSFTSLYTNSTYRNDLLFNYTVSNTTTDDIFIGTVTNTGSLGKYRGNFSPLTEDTYEITVFNLTETIAETTKVSVRIISSSSSGGTSTIDPAALEFYDQYNTLPGLTSYWSFNGQNGTFIEDHVGDNDLSFFGTTNDSSSSEEHLTPRGNPTLVTGNFSSAYQTDNNNYFKTGAHDYEFVASDSFTIEAWVNVTEDDIYFAAGLWGDGGTNRQQYAIGVLGSSNGNAADFALRRSGGVSAPAIGTTALNDSQWHHIAGVYNTTHGMLFVDGNLEAVSTISTLRNTLANIPFTVGSLDGQFADSGGYVDEVRLSNTTRYTANFTPSTTAFTTDSSTIGLWHLDEQNSPNGRVDGYYGDTYEMDDTKFYADGNHTLERSSTDSFTFNQWIKTNSTINQFSGLWSTNVGGQQYALGSSVGEALWIVEDSGGTQLGVDSSVNISDDEWHMLTGIYNTTHIVLYVDGELDGATAVTSLQNIPDDVPFSVGSLDGDSGENLWKVDEVSFYDRSLKQSEVRFLYESGSDYFESNQLSNELAQINSTLTRWEADFFSNWNTTFDYWNNTLYPSWQTSIDNIEEDVDWIRNNTATQDNITTIRNDIDSLETNVIGNITSTNSTIHSVLNTRFDSVDNSLSNLTLQINETNTTIHDHLDLIDGNITEIDNVLASIQSNQTFILNNVSAIDSQFDAITYIQIEVEENTNESLIFDVAFFNFEREFTTTLDQDDWDIIIQNSKNNVWDSNDFNDDTCVIGEFQQGRFSVDCDITKFSGDIDTNNYVVTIEMDTSSSTSAQYKVVKIEEDVVFEAASQENEQSTLGFTGLSVAPFLSNSVNTLYCTEFGGSNYCISSFLIWLVIGLITLTIIIRMLYYRYKKNRNWSDSFTKALGFNV